MDLVELSEWDTNHFGFKVAKIETTPRGQISEIIEQCCRKNIKLLICRCNTNDIIYAHSLEEEGFELMGTLVTYSAELENMQTLPIPDRVVIRPFQEEDIGFIADIAAKGFKNYIDHFHADPRLNADKCDDLYHQWAHNSCYDKSLADEVLVAEIGKHIVGFLTIKVMGGEAGELVLAGVNHDTRGKGVYQSFIAAGINWCKYRGLSRVESKTQINNYAVQKVWSDLGLRISNSFYILHKWF